MRISLRMTSVYTNKCACVHAKSCKSNQHEINDSEDGMKWESAFDIAI